MKKLLVLLSVLFVSAVAVAHTINWHTENEMIQTTSCEIGNDVTPPTPSVKRGYRFKEWRASDNLFDITALQRIVGITIIDSDTFSVVGYPSDGIMLYRIAPGLNVGDTIKITGVRTCPFTPNLFYDKIIAKER